MLFDNHGRHGLRSSEYHHKMEWEHQRQFLADEGYVIDAEVVGVCNAIEGFSDGDNRKRMGEWCFVTKSSLWKGT